MTALWVSLVDSEYRRVGEADVLLEGPEGEQRLRFDEEEGFWIRDSLEGSTAVVIAAPRGNRFRRERRIVRLRDAVNRIVIGLRREGEFGYSYGNSRFAVVPDESSYLLQIKNNPDSQLLLRSLREHQPENWEVLARTVNGNTSLARVRESLEHGARTQLQLSAAGIDARVLLAVAHGDRRPAGLSNEAIVRFQDDVSPAEARQLAARFGLAFVRQLSGGGNTYLLRKEGLPSYELLESVDRLADTGQTVYAEPNLVIIGESDEHVPNDPLWAQVPYLQLINAPQAWAALAAVGPESQGGLPVIAIAIVDKDGIDPTHGDLNGQLTDGRNKLVGCWNFIAEVVTDQTAAALAGDHGTQCAATATAGFDDHLGLPGVAPNCRLLGAQTSGETQDVLRLRQTYLYLAGLLSTPREPDFPVNDPEQPADIISTSWGQSGVELSDDLRHGFEVLTTHGRGGRGCILCFSIGNTGHVEFTDPTEPTYRAWPTYERALAVGASICSDPTSPVSESAHASPDSLNQQIPVAKETRSLYSPYGNKLLGKPDLVAPSSTAIFKDRSGTALHVDPIMSAVRTGHGNVDGGGAGVSNDYRQSFGGTSHSTAAVAGAAALVLSARPELSWVQVREILRNSCLRIDPQQRNARGRWFDLDNDGTNDFSRWYGAGRLDVGAAVAAALDPQLPLPDAFVRDRLTDEGDLSSGFFLPESPDVWVRQDAAEPIPTLAWNAEPPHQNVKAGQDNAVFCRVSNRGTAVLPVVYLRAVALFGDPLDVSYPEDYRVQPWTSSQVQDITGSRTYEIGVVRLDNLGPGQNKIIKVIWRKHLIPSLSTAIGTIDARSHPCLLLEASPHDGPFGGAPGRPSNNISVRNVQVVQQSANATVIDRIVAGSDMKEVVSLLVVAQGFANGVDLDLAVDDAALMQNVINAATELNGSPVGSLHQTSTLGRPTLSIASLAGSLELPLPIQAGRRVTILIALRRHGNGSIHITQKHSTGGQSVGFVLRSESAQ